MTFKTALFPALLFLASTSAQAHSDHSYFHAAPFQQLMHFLSSPDHMALTILFSAVALFALKKWASKKSATQKLRNKK